MSLPGTIYLTVGDTETWQSRISAEVSVDSWDSNYVIYLAFNREVAGCCGHLVFVELEKLLKLEMNIIVDLSWCDM